MIARFMPLRCFSIVCLLVLALAPAFSPAAAQETPIEEQVGRLLLLAFPGAEPPLDRLSEFSPAGFLYYPSNVPSTEAARASTRALQASADYPLLFGIDQEGGPFTSYRVDEATLFPGSMALAAAGDPKLATAAAKATGRELGHAGFNMSFSPVVDVNINPDNPIIGIRSFGSEAEVVGEFGSAFLAGLEETGIAGVAKHFPGHGDTVTDSHLGLPRVTSDLADLAAVELPPFRRMVAAGVPGIMTAHVVFPAFDADVPATLSSPVLTGLLRDEMGFEGLIVTDYMDMDAIVDNYGAGEAAVMSVAAGADLVLLGPDLQIQRTVHAALEEAVSSGELSESRVLEAIARSEAVARRYPPGWDEPAPNYHVHRQLAAEVAERGATLLWNDGVLPLDPRDDVLVVAPTPALFGTPPHLGAVLERHRGRVTSLPVGEAPSVVEIAEAVSLARDADVVVLGSYHWLGPFPASMNTLASRLAEAGTPLVVVALGNPDDLRFLEVRPEAYLAVYGYREANLEGASSILTGKATPGGKLPVPAGTYGVGEGMDGF